MKTKEFANKFGVSVEEMCRITELSRQGLNYIVSGKSPNPSKAKRIALYNLRDYAAIRRKQEVDKANEDYENRMKMAEIFFVN
jgi:transcriptional regulator with XRE-family HTH domain